MFGILKNKDRFSPRKTTTRPISEGPGGQIDPADGKTKGCDRAKTFETFIDKRKMGADHGKTEAIGATYDVKKGLGKLKRLFSNGKIDK